MREPVFLLGAGFNVAANEQCHDAGGSYPLVGDLAQACFGIAEPPKGRTIEDLFQDAMDANQARPIDIMTQLIMQADYYITQCLSPQGPDSDNLYSKFLQAFDTPLLTYNYDGLVDILLFQAGRWRPEDGYGVPVIASVADYIGHSHQLPSESHRKVLHLHGSLYVYASEFQIVRQPGRGIDLLELKDQPDFVFDPDSVTHRFLPYERPPPGADYQHVPERVIAPVPSKAKHLTRSFVREMQSLAESILKEADTLVAIGYSFNEYDKDSFSFLLNSCPGAKVVVVDPQADEIVSRLGRQYSNHRWMSLPIDFEMWVRMNYPLA